MFMYLKNPLYSYIYEHINKINGFIASEYYFKPKFNMFDKNSGVIIDFKCFNVNSIYTTPKGLIIEEFKYDNSLEFTLNKETNEIYIYKIPILIYNNIKIPIFTSDIANIIKDCISNYCDVDDVKIVFSDKYSPLAIDKNVKKILPSITNTNNYDTTEKLIVYIEKELEKINKTTLSYKQHQDKYIKRMERIYERKRKICGIDPIDYTSIDDFYEAVNIKIKSKVENILKKIERHLNNTKKAYKKILWDQFTNIYNLENKTNYNIEELKSLLKKDKNNTQYIVTLFFDGYLDLANYDEILSSSNNNYDVIDYYIEQIFNYELHNDEGLVNKIKYIKKEYNTLTIDERFPFKNNLYASFLYEFNNDNFIDYFNGKNRGLYNCNEKLKPEKIATYLSCESNLFKAIDLIWQYYSLIKDKEYYTEIIENLDQVTIDLDKEVKNYGEILQLPYWFIEDAGLYDLLMIKPGTNKFNINKIVYFDRTKNNGRRNKYNLNIVGSSRYLNFPLTNKSLNRICITIPSSLEINSIKEIIDTFRNKYDYEAIYFICENFTSYYIVKDYIVTLSLKELTEPHKICNSDLIFYDEIYNDSKRTFVCIDPNYYNNFFTTTPSVNEFYHLYDYTSNYRFRRKKPLCIEDLTELFINREKEENGFLNIDKIKANILGSYDSIDEQFLKGNQIDEIKYCALANHIEPLFNKRKYNASKYNLLYSISEELEKNIDSAKMVIKENEAYRPLRYDELIKVFKLGITDNVQVALYIKNNMFLWNNFPYIPVEIVEINENEKSKELIK